VGLKRGVMFTGIIDHCGEILAIEQNTTQISLTVRSKFDDLLLGESIAIDGVCLTVTYFQNNTFKVELSPETMYLTFARNYQPNLLVNLERALRLSDRLGGHFVTGHVDGVCEVEHIQAHGEFKEIIFKGIKKSFKPFLVRKGSVAINGVSLTINAVAKDNFSTMLIPHTLQQTTLSQLKVGHNVNIEFDYLAKLVFNQLKGEQNEKYLSGDYRRGA
jgi:riboflavin synthase